MTRKPRRRASPPVKKKQPIRAQRGQIRRPRPDPLDTFIASAAPALNLPIRRAWLPAIKANLRVTLQHAATVSAFDLSDDAEPSPVFKA